MKNRSLPEKVGWQDWNSTEIVDENTFWVFKLHLAKGLKFKWLANEHKIFLMTDEFINEWLKSFSFEIEFEKV